MNAPTLIRPAVPATPGLFAMLLMMALPAWSQTADPNAPPEQVFTIKPVMLDASKSTGATVGLEYTYFYRSFRKLDSNDAGKPDFSFADVVLRSVTTEVRGSGTLAASVERNPNKLLDLGASLRYDRSLGADTVVGAGARLKAETDQSFDDKQFGYSLELRGGVNNPLGPEGWLLAYLNFGRIDPKGDHARSKALGGASLSAYPRWDAEAIYHIDLKGRIGGTSLRSLEVQYRHFQEVGAPVAIENAGLDRHRLGTVRLNFRDDLFVAFSKGSLPFDKQSDRSVKIGFAYQLK
jgi:hypothetical protein